MKESLSGILGEGIANIVLFILLFTAILMVIVIFYSIIKRYSGTNTDQRLSNRHHHEPSPRLAVVDAAIVDNQRKLVLVRRDDVEHLILIGGPADVVVEQNITVDSDYARGSRITEAQIARYQNNQADDFHNQDPALSAHHQRPETLALDRGPGSVSAHKAVDISQTTPMHEPAPIRSDTPLQQASYQSEPADSPTSLKGTTTSPVFTKPVTAPHVQQVKPITPQPRIVTPAAPVAKPVAHPAHPAYPLSQVSQGVLTSTSTAASSAAVTATALSSASGRLDSVTPQKTSSLEEARPSSTTANFSSQHGTKAEPSFDPEPSDEKNNFTELDDALNQALFNDLNKDFLEGANTSANRAEDEMAMMLEEELLSSLNEEMNPDEIDIETELAVDIEDEMEKLLGELSIHPER